MAEQRVPNDLLLLIFEQVDNVSTLSNLAQAYPSLLVPLLERRFECLVSKCFDAQWWEELQFYAYVILSAEVESPGDVPCLKVLLDDLIKGSAPMAIPTSLPRTLDTLKKLANLVDAVEFFLHFCSILFLTNYDWEIQAPLSPGETFRIRRALLRFQLYTQLFHQPEATDEIVSDQDWENRPKPEQYFWTRFESVEVEECKCIYAMLFNVLAQLRSCQTPDEIKANNAEKSRQRGLPLLQQVLSGGSISPLASSYAERFVDYAFTGLDKLDPHDGNYFLPNKDFQNPDPPLPRRYPPTEAHLEWSFGVKMRRPPPKYWEPERKDDRTPWRLMGYCFWDDDRVEVLRRQTQRDSETTL